MKKLFGELDLTWKKIIICAIIAGVYTGIMAILPITKDTSFQDITTTFECWILFGILIILNSTSPLDSALKCFVFFLISQPLVYLIQVPFNVYGWGIMGFYKNWIVWTLLTLPMGYIGWYMKKDQWWGILILTPMMLFLGLHYTDYLAEAISFFPNHLLTSLFCIAVLILCGLYVFEDPKVKKIQTGINLLIIIAATVWALMNPRAYNTSLFPEGVTLKGDETVYFEDERFGTAEVVFEKNLEEYMIGVQFTKLGKTKLYIVTPEGETYIYELNVSRNSYEAVRIE